ncbi:MAG: hypothetical protein JWR21_2154 [Herminiimonas sp.]|nr:hypothetical protein [Herminiimonas sp.]
MRRLVVTVLCALGIGASQAATPLKAAGGADQPRKAKSIDVARAILKIPKNRDSWQNYIQKEQNEEQFIWPENGEQVDRWNELAGAGAGLQNVKKIVVKGKDVLSYKGRTLRPPFVQDREDDTIEIVTLNRLVRPDSEIRFCVDSWHSSEIAFLPLPPVAWRALEAEFGVEAVAYRFMPLPDDMVKFWKVLNAKSDEAAKRKYIDK